MLSLTNGKGQLRAVVTVAWHCGAPVRRSQTGDVGERAGRHRGHESGAEVHQGGFHKVPGGSSQKKPLGAPQVPRGALKLLRGAPWVCVRLSPQERTLL